MLTTFRKALKSLHMPSREILERRYLDEAVSLYDLERREREIDRGRFWAR